MRQLLNTIFEKGGRIIEKLPDNVSAETVKKNFYVVLIGMICLLVSVIILLIFMQVQLKRHLIIQIEKEQQLVLPQILARETEEIRNDLDEKYRADLVSFEAIKRRLDIEKGRVTQLRRKIKDLKRR